MSSINIKKLGLKQKVALSNFTTWRIGGEAEWFAEPQSIEEITLLIKWSNENNLICQVIGGGSNLLINDQGLQGLFISTKKLRGYQINEGTGEIEALSGESIPSLAGKAAKAGLEGLEWSIGIPGTVGGVCVMNAGAQGGSIAQCLESVRVLPLNGDCSYEITKDNLNYSYRNSILQKEKVIVISAKFKLKPGYDPKEVSNRTKKNLNHRTETQPYNLPSCGSVFRNPEPHKAGELIESLGLKGYSIGGAEISRVHANFIVNNGNATAKDVQDLIDLIQEKVKANYGFCLHTEVKRIGFS